MPKNWMKKYPQLRDAEGKDVPLTGEQAALAEEWQHLAAWAVRQWPGLVRRLRDRDEAFGLARLAIVEAARRFDPARGITFATYATKYIYGYLQRGHYLGGIIRNKFYCGDPLRVGSLDKEVGTGKRPACLKDFLPAKEAGTALGLDVDERDAIARALSFLDRRHREIIRLRFVDGKTLDAIAQALGVTRERVRQMETAALERLRRLLCITADGAVRMARDSEVAV